MSRAHKVHELVKDRAELEQLEAFVREDPDCSVNKAHEWLLAKGYTLGRSSVGRWLKQFNAEDRVRRAAEISRSYLDVAKDVGAAEIATASLQKFQQILFDHLLEADGVDAGNLMKLSISLKTAVQSGRQIEQLKKETAERQERAVKEAEKVAKSGGDGETVARKMRELLGLGK